MAPMVARALINISQSFAVSTLPDTHILDT